MEKVFPHTRTARDNSAPFSRDCRVKVEAGYGPPHWHAPCDNLSLANCTFQACAEARRTFLESSDASSTGKIEYILFYVSIMTHKDVQTRQDGELRRVDDIISFLNAVRNEDALLTDSNETGITRCHTIGVALLQLGIERLGSLRTIGEVRSALTPIRDDLARFRETRGKTREGNS